MAKPVRAQFDLFGAPLPVATKTIAPPAADRARPHFPTPPTLTWAHRLTEARDIGRRVRFEVSFLWTGVVVEALCEGATRRTLLERDGTMREIAPDGGQSYRLIYLDPERVKALHSARPLIAERVGPSSAHYRFAEPGEVTDAILPLPTRYGEP